MIAQAKGRYLRVSPTKVRLILDLIRGKKVPVAQSILAHLNKPTKEKIVKVFVDPAVGLADYQVRQLLFGLRFNPAEQKNAARLIRSL